MLIRLCLHPRLAIDSAQWDWGITPGVLIPTYSYYFLTQFGTFLFVHVKYYVELSSVLPCSYFHCERTVPNWRKKDLTLQQRRMGANFKCFTFSSRFGIVRLGHKLCDKEDNYTFSMCITTNEKYSCWAQLGIWNYLTYSKLSYRPAEATWTRRTLFELIVIVIVITRMTRNDQEWSPEQTRIVNSSSFGSRFGTVRLWYDQ